MLENKPSLFLFSINGSKEFLSFNLSILLTTRITDVSLGILSVFVDRLLASPIYLSGIKLCPLPLRHLLLLYSYSDSMPLFDLNENRLFTKMIWFSDSVLIPKNLCRVVCGFLDVIAIF